MDTKYERMLKENMKLFNEVLKTLRVINGYNGKDLSKELGMSPSYVTLVEMGKRKPNLKMLERYCTVFNLDLATLFYLESEFSRNPDMTTYERFKCLVNVLSLKEN